jgi:hypothetical protein
MAIGLAGFFLSDALTRTTSAASHCVSPVELLKSWANLSQSLDFIGFLSKTPVDNILKFI